MYIPRPAKLLFTVNDAWNTFLEKFGDSVSPWTRLCVERMLSCGTTAMGEALLLFVTRLHPHPLFLPELQVKGLQRLRLQSYRAVGVAAESYPSRL